MVSRQTFPQMFPKFLTCSLEIQPPNGIGASESSRVDAVLRKAAVRPPMLQGQNSPKMAKLVEKWGASKGKMPQALT